MSREKRDTIQYARDNDPKTARVYVENPTTKGNKAKKAAVAAFVAACIAYAITVAR